MKIDGKLPADAFLSTEAYQQIALEIKQKNQKIEELAQELHRARATMDFLDRGLNEILTPRWRLTSFQRKLWMFLPYGVRAVIRPWLAQIYRRFLVRTLSRRLLARVALELPQLSNAKQTLQEQDRPVSEYESWTKQYDTLNDVDRNRIQKNIKKLAHRPLISVIVPVYETPESILRKMIDSVRSQIYPDWELCLSDDASKSPHVRAVIDEYAASDPRIKPVYRKTNGHISAASNSALALASGQYLALLDHDDILPEHALYMFAEAILKNPTADLFYSDEDKLDADGIRCDPNFKPDWNPELIFGQNYLNHLSVYRRSVVEKVGGFRIGYEGSQDYDLALRVIAATTGPIIHIPHILYHWRIYDGAGTMSSANLDRALAAARHALTDHFNQQGEPVTIDPVLGSFHRVIRPDPAVWPKISVVIPTRDHLDVLEVAIDGLVEKTDYPNLEIIVADNDSIEPETLAYFAKQRDAGVTILSHPGPFNYSAINNDAVAKSSGELVLLLNNDISMIEPHWLKEMARYFSDPSVGIVGAKLLYPDGILQHAGVILGIGGVAGHWYVNKDRYETGSFGRLALSQDISCVTGACLLIRRSAFDEVGGLDAKNLTVAFNDVDLCIRVREAGYRIIWTPHAELYHHESRSRGLDLTGEKQARFQKEVAFMIGKWGKTLQRDPFYNPNLSLESTTPGLSHPPRQPEPWHRDRLSL